MCIYLILVAIGCNSIPLKKVYLETNHPLIGSFNFYDTVKCSIAYEFIKMDDAENANDNSRILSLKMINDSTMEIKTFVVKEDTYKIIGNMGQINMKKQLIHESMQEFIISVYQKAFGECN